jgi:hypothetical protein
MTFELALDIQRTFKQLLNLLQCLSPEGYILHEANNITYACSLFIICAMCFNFELSLAVLIKLTF